MFLGENLTAFARACLLSTSLLALGGGAAFAASSDPLAAGFAKPPNSAKPRVWWHWMNGNITKDGIGKDLHWMARVGIGGAQTFDASLLTPKIVPHRLAYMTPDWKDAFHYATVTADQLGLELGIAGSPGWSESGGPWVQPKDGMKKYVWSETVIEGGKHFDGTLPQPPSTTGPYQSLPMPAGGLSSLDPDASHAPPPTYYGDSVVVAYRLDDAPELPSADIETGSGQKVDPNLLVDPAGAGVGVSPGKDDKRGSIVIDYGRPQTIRAASAYVPGGSVQFFGPMVAPALEAQDDSGNWQKVADIPAAGGPTTVSFAPVTARRFRLILDPPPPGKGLSFGSGIQGVALPPFNVPSPPKTIKVSQFQLFAEPKVNRAEIKAGFAMADDYYALDSGVGPEVTGISPQSVVDLTAKMTADGHLDWTPPPGRWKVIRLGYSLEGTTNHPATAEATGLEVDEYDATAVRNYLETYLGKYQAITGPDLMGKRGLRAQVNDSTEVGPSNWTPAMLDQFQKLRGYDPRPWLPALTGVVVGSRAQSDAFLYDFRRTLADLVSTEHYKTIAAVVHEHGMIEYGEALESQRVSLGDDMDMRSYTDVPMSAFWTYDTKVGPNLVYLSDIKGAASVAHIYGQNLVAAESMTSVMAPWAYAPHDLKKYIDMEFVTGVNRPVVHTSVHQPVDDKVPGLSLMIFGQYFNRHETWAEMAKPWVDYISRNAYLLQQGRNFADVAYFYGEEGPLIALYDKALPADAPSHYAYDYVNANILANKLTVAGGDLVAPSGARYRALYLGGSSSRMTVGVLKRLAELADAGATIVGTAPQSSPSLKDDPAEFTSLVQRLWSGGAVTHVGKGQVIASHDIEAALQSNGVTPDFRYTSDAADSQVLFLHRRLKDGDIYFLNNRKDRAEHIEAHFRVTGKAPMLWHADTGTATPVSYRIAGGETIVPLDMDAEDAVFVVFRTPSKTSSRTVTATQWTPVAELGGAWDLTFQPDRAAPPSAHLEKLQSLSENTDPGIKYFSGEVTYRTSFALPRGVRPGAPLILDLGKVADIAQVTVNGHDVGYAWKAPFRVDIGKAVKPGQNTVEIKVADLWINRLIGDAQPGANKITFTTMPTYLPSAPLRPSGLIGPVTLMTSAGRGANE
jgi:hypothetical protein